MEELMSVVKPFCVALLATASLASAHAAETTRPMEGMEPAPGLESCAWLGASGSTSGRTGPSLPGAGANFVLLLALRTRTLASCDATCGTGKAGTDERGDPAADRAECA